MRPFAEPFKAEAGIAVLRGNLAPNGAVIKPSAASPHLLKHRGRAVVFENIEDFKARIDDENLDIDEHCIMVLKNCGPRGYPGMAEVGNMPLAAEGAAQGHHRHGAHLRCAHERHGLRHRGAARVARSRGRRPARAGEDRRHDRARRRRAPPASGCERRRAREAARELDTQPPAPTRGWYKLYVDHVQQAHLGADLDILVGHSGVDVPRDSH